MNSNSNETAEEVEYTSTTWHNDAEQTCRFEIRLRHGSAQGKARVQKVVVQPGGSVTLSSEFDQAVQQVDKEGVIVGGKAPWLRKGDVKPKLAPALDWFAISNEEKLQREYREVEREQKMAVVSDRVKAKSAK